MSQVPEFDVLIIGAGISGIDAAYHLQTLRPGTRFAMLESKDAMGGTWQTHRFPGIRSDSDLYTFGFKWKPWTGVPIATAPEILSYLNEALDENDLRRHIRYGHEVQQADWSDADQMWTMTVGVNGQIQQMRAGFLWICAGYYDHDVPHVPTWPGQDQFAGRIVHPQIWPEDLDHSDKRVVVIGSGATAATIVPEMAKTAAHVTMLQRSPTYFYARPMVDEFTQTLRSLELPDEWFHEIMRRKSLLESQVTTRRSFEEPDVLADELISGVRAYMSDDFDVEKHFRPSYRPWRQRLAMVPDGDLFVALNAGHASVVTDQITRLDQDGIVLDSGETLPADIIVTATGFELNVLGDIAIHINGAPVDAANCWTHRGVMLSGLPNLAMVFGYLRTSWTMRANLVSEYVCRVMAHMDATGARSVTPALRDSDLDMPERPWVDPENFNAGYLTRKLHVMPKQGDRQPWLMTQDYYSDRDTLPAADLTDGTLRFT
ncbi:MAG: flavin-containing monooxygenase [Sedimentitalea sp.]